MTTESIVLKSYLEEDTSQLGAASGAGTAYYF